MITFKQFLQEDGSDITHNMAEAVDAYLKNCKQWQNVEKPLHRFSREQEDMPMPMRTRSVRDRLSSSLGGTKLIQDYIFSQPGWEDYPPRSRSIFCSTTQDSALGDTNLMIYPFDDTKIAVVNGFDLNLMNILVGVPEKEREKRRYLSMNPFVSQIRSGYVEIFQPEIRPALKDFVKLINEIKEKFTKNGEFDETANGDDELAEAYDNAPSMDREMFRIIVNYVPECFRPGPMGFKLVSSSNIELNGREGREVWFSGKYLSIPKAYHQQFVEEVKAKQK
ncbi:hypothetical protein [Acinetobacter sp.]|uniref:hypothetical protein n=1 Tax=Acinetobacter sp. TaxID=472 RepID=UPI00388E30BC